MIRSSIVLIWAFLYSFFCAKVFASGGAKDKEMRGHLLGALKRRHSGLKPLPFVRPGVMDFRSCILECLDVVSLKRISQTNHLFHQFSKALQYSRLYKFDPYFMTEDRLVNEFLYYVLLEHFPISKGGSVRDDLQLLAMKFVYGELDYKVLPRNVYFYVISFMYDFVFGPGAAVPTSVTSCKISFLRLVQQEKLPKSLAYLAAKHEGYISFFTRKKQNHPSARDILAHFSINRIDSDLVGSLFSRYECEIAVAILEGLTDEIPTALLPMVLETLNTQNVSSRLLMNRFVLVAGLAACRELLGTLVDPPLTFGHKSVLFKVLGGAEEREFSVFYGAISSFSLVEYEAENFGSEQLMQHLKDLIGGEEVSLFTLQAFSDLLHLASEKILNDLLKELTTSTCALTQDLYLEVLLRESERPLDCLHVTSYKRRIDTVALVMTPLALMVVYPPQVFDLLSLGPWAAFIVPIVFELFFVTTAIFPSFYMFYERMENRPIQPSQRKFCYRLLIFHFILMALIVMKTQEFCVINEGANRSISLF
jgi:hypothetical protein